MPHHQVWKQKGEEYRLFGGGGWVWTSGLQCRKRKRPTGDAKDTFVNKKRKLLDTTNRISALKEKKRKEELKEEADKAAKIAAAQQAVPQTATTPALAGQTTSTTMPTTAIAVQSSASVQNAVSSTPSLSQNSVQTTATLKLASSAQITSSATTASTSCSITSTTPLTVASLVPQTLSSTWASVQSCVNPAIPASKNVSTGSPSVISVSATSQTASSTVPTSLSSVECSSTTSSSLTVASSLKSVATVLSIQTLPTKTSSDNVIQSPVRIVSSTSLSTSFLNSAASSSPSMKGCSLNATLDKGSSSLDVNRSNLSITFAPAPLTIQESVSSSEVVSSGAIESPKPSTPTDTVSTLALAKDSVVAPDSSPVILQDTSSESVSVSEGLERSETRDNLPSVSISNGESNTDKNVLVDCPTVKFPSGVSTEDTTQMESTYDRAPIYYSEQNADKEKLEYNNDVSVDCSTLESSCGASSAQNTLQVESITENAGNKEFAQNQLNVDNLTSQNDGSTSFVSKGSEGNDKPNLTSDSLDKSCLEDVTITDSNVKQSTSPFDSCTRQERLVTVDSTQDTKFKKDELSESQQVVSEFVNVQCDNKADKHDGEVTPDTSSSLQVEGDGYEVLEESRQAVYQENQNPSLSVENEMQGIAITKPDILGGHKDLNNSPCSSDTDANEREKEIKPVDEVLVNDKENELCTGRISNNVLSDGDVLEESQSKRTSLNDSLTEEVSGTERAEKLPDASTSAKGKQCLGIVNKDVITVANHDMSAENVADCLEPKSSLEDLCNHVGKDDFSDEKSAIASSCSKVKDGADVSSSQELTTTEEAHGPSNSFEAEQSTAVVSCGGATDTQTMKAKGGDNGQIGALWENTTSSNRDVSTDCSSGEDSAVQGSRSDDSCTASVSTVSTSHLGESHNEQETPVDVDVDVTTVSPSRPTSEMHVCSTTDAHVSPQVDSSVILSATFADSEPVRIREAEPMDIDGKAVSTSESSCSETSPRMSKNSGDDCSSLPTEVTSTDTTANRGAASLDKKNCTSSCENSTTSIISAPKTSTTVSSGVNAVSTCGVTTAKSVMPKSTCTTPATSSTPSKTVPAMPVPASPLSVSLPSVLVQCATSIDKPSTLSTVATNTFTETAAVNIKPLLPSVALQRTGVVSTSPRNVVAIATPLASSVQSTAVKGLVVNTPTGSVSTRITTAQKTAISSRIQTAQYVPIGPKPILPSPRLTGQSIVVQGTNVVQPTVVGQASTAPVNSMAALVARIPGSGATIGPSQLIRLVTADGKSITLQGSQLAAIAQQMGSPMQLAVPKTITVQVSGATVQQNPVKTVGASTTATTITVQRPQQQSAQVKPQVVIKPKVPAKPIKEEKFPSLEPLIKDPRALLNRRIAKWPLRHSVKSLFTLEKHERRKLGRKAGMKEVNGYVYTSRAVGVNWPVGIPRPSFKVAWRFRTQSLKTLAGAAIQLRILQSCLKWDEMNVRPPRGNNNTVYTSSG